MALPPSPHRALPGLLEQLLVLPPLVRILAGLLMLGMGIVGICLQVSGYSVVLLLLGVGLGGPLVIQGSADRRSQQLEAVEWMRARGELAALRDLVARAVAEKRNVARLLRDRGYQCKKVRGWIARECEVVPPRH